MGALSQNAQTTAGQSYTGSILACQCERRSRRLHRQVERPNASGTQECSGAGVHGIHITMLSAPPAPLNLEFDFRQDPSPLEPRQHLGDGGRLPRRMRNHPASQQADGRTGASGTQRTSSIQSGAKPTYDSVGTMATSCSAGILGPTSSGSGASVSTPQVVAQMSSPPPVTLLSPFHA